jgi:hypothetical protein
MNTFAVPLCVTLYRPWVILLKFVICVAFLFDRF